LPLQIYFKLLRGEEEEAAGVLSLTFAAIAVSLSFSLSSQDVDRALAFFRGRRREDGEAKSGGNSWQRLEKLENSAVCSINQWSVLSVNHTKVVAKIYM